MHFILSWHDGIQTKVSSRAPEARGPKQNNIVSDKRWIISRHLGLDSICKSIFNVPHQQDRLALQPSPHTIFQLSRRAASLQKSHRNTKRKQSAVPLIFSWNAGHFQAVCVYACVCVCVCVSMTTVSPSQGQLSDSVCRAGVKHCCTTFSSAFSC